MLRGCESTDPRDKIFEFMGLATDLQDKTTFHPDYSKPVICVYSEFVGFLITEKKSLEFLQLACREVDSELPSWAPDWRQSLFNSNLRPPYDPRAPPFSAANKSVTIAHLPEDLKTLIVQGFTVQTIEQLGDSLHHPRSHLPIPKEVIVTIIKG
jgi:hypothetical protein